MPWTIPDKGEGQNDIQSILFQEYLDVLVAGIRALDAVLFGCACTAQGTPDMTVAVAKGGVLSNGVMFPVTAGNVTIGTADATNPRIDLIVVNSSGTKAVRAGTAAAAPKPPARTANDVVLAVVYVPANDTTISSDQIVDMRVLRDHGPIEIHEQTAGNTVNNTAAAIHILNPSGSGVVIPNGMLLAGRSLRIRAGGNYLINSGTPTVTFAVSFGGTTMFSDVSGASTADADRRSWYIDLELTAQGNAAQRLTGIVAHGKIAASTAPTTGIGDAWDTAAIVSPVRGTAAVDADAADRTLAITLTFSVANAANEHVTDFVTIDWH